MRHVNEVVRVQRDMDVIQRVLQTPHHRRQTNLHVVVGAPDVESALGVAEIVLRIDHYEVDLLRCALLHGADSSEKRNGTVI
jgi:hypothetical protein